jgi:hypothetical protein
MSRGQPRKNPCNLRVVKTARTEKAINSAAKEGFRPLVKAVKPDPEIGNTLTVYQHRESGEIKVVGDCRYHPEEGYERVLPYIHYYTYHFPQPYAAYLVPPDLEEGEHVWLDDIIEDIIAVYGNQGYRPRLEAGEAVWTKGDFKILFDPEKDAEVWIG